MWLRTDPAATFAKLVPSANFELSRRVGRFVLRTIPPLSRGNLWLSARSDWIRPEASGADELVGGVGAPGAAFVGVELGGEFGFPCFDVWIDDRP